MAEQKAKVVKVGRGGPRGPRPKVQNPGKIFMRILRYVMECYRIQVVAVVICIFVSVFANVQGTLFMQTLIDGYILPLLKEQSSDFSGLAHAIAAPLAGLGGETMLKMSLAMAICYLLALLGTQFWHIQIIGNPALQSHDLLQTTVMGNIGRFRRPGRDGARARSNEEQNTSRGVFGYGRAVGQQLA